MKKFFINLFLSAVFGLIVSWILFILGFKNFWSAFISTTIVVDILIFSDTCPHCFSVGPMKEADYQFRRNRITSSGIARLCNNKEYIVTKEYCCKEKCDKCGYERYVTKIKI